MRAKPNQSQKSRWTTNQRFISKIRNGQRNRHKARLKWKIQRIKPFWTCTDKTCHTSYFSPANQSEVLDSFFSSLQRLLFFNVAMYIGADLARIQRASTSYFQRPLLVLYEVCTAAMRDTDSPGPSSADSSFCHFSPDHFFDFFSIPSR